MGLDDSTYEYMYPLDVVSLSSIGFPRSTSQTPSEGLQCPSHMEWLRYSPGYLNPWLVSPPPHSYTQDFVKLANKLTLQPGECLSSYDVTALFTSVPVDPALGIIKGLLEEDRTLKERTVLPVKDIILLLGFCLDNRYFSFMGQFYEQVEGANMGSPVSPIMANLYMEYFEQKSVSTATHP